MCVCDLFHNICFTHVHHTLPNLSSCPESSGRRSSPSPRWNIAVETGPTPVSPKFSPIIFWLVLSREWMGMGVAGIVINKYYGSFPHSRSEAPVSFPSEKIPGPSIPVSVSRIFPRIFQKNQFPPNISLEFSGKIQASMAPFSLPTASVPLGLKATASMPTGFQGHSRVRRSSMAQAYSAYGGGRYLKVTYVPRVIN